MADDSTGFAGFYEASRDRCLRAVRASAGDQQLAEDLVAEAFVRALMAWPTVRRHPAPEAWVVRTALNTRVSWWRRRHREVSHIVSAARARRRRRGLAGAGLAAAAGLALSLTLSLSPAGAGPSAPTAPASTPRLAAWTVRTSPDSTVTLTLRQLADPAALRHALFAHGIPAIVHAGTTICQEASGNPLPGLSRVISPARGQWPVVIRIRPLRQPRAPATPAPASDPASMPRDTA